MKQLDFNSLQRRLWVVFRFCSSFSYSDCNRYRPGTENKFRKQTSASLELDIVSKTTQYEQLLTRIFINPNHQGTHMRIETNHCQAQVHTTWHKRVSGVWSGWYWILLGKWSLGSKRRPQARKWYPLSPTTFEDLEMGGSAKTSLGSTTTKTRCNLFQQRQTLRDQHDSLQCWELVYLEQE